MATRSTIAIEREDGSVAQVYCHWDGYIEHNGLMLNEFYSDRESVHDLISFGDISMLNSETDECQFYARDRGETGVSANIFDDFEQYLRGAQFEEYNYIFRRDGEWYVSVNPNIEHLHLLSDVLDNDCSI